MLYSSLTHLKFEIAVRFRELDCLQGECI